jgi:hypothetical protein
VSTLAHVFEAAGLHTVILASNRSVAEKMHPPRSLYCEFPLGRPLGEPNDAEFQRRVLVRALQLVETATEPTIVDYDVVIEAETEALACNLPPRFDPDLLPAIDEANGIRKAYDRAISKRGHTSVGRVATADDLVEVLAAFDRIANGTDWLEAGLPSSDPINSVHDLRTYYEEAALELVDGPTPGGRAAEEWFYESTEAGTTVMEARRAMRAADAPRAFWYYMAPGHRS